MVRLSRAGVFVCGALLFGNVAARTPLQTFEKCRYLPNRSNDGDSFHVMANGKEYLFRLYFVDAPETDAEFPDRVAEQAKYFGVTPEQAIKIGEAAKRFTKEKLAGGFTVRTSMQGALGQSRLERFYAFVQTKSGDLGELLVENGLARLHGTEAKPVGLSNADREWERLQRLEALAKADKRGGWGINVGRLNARAPARNKQDDADWFRQFFHPEQAADAPTPVPEPTTRFVAPTSSIGQPTTSTAPAVVSGKLDINTATEDQLKNLPGIGEVMAQRIIAARPFATADDLRKVKGIGPKRYEKLRPYFD